MYQTAIIFPFILLNLIMASFYFFLFSMDSRGGFIKYWGFCWVFYSGSLLFLFLYMSHPSIYFLGLRKTMDMLNISYLLFGAYAFARLPIPGYWYRFSLYLFLWMGIGTYYDFDLISLFLPVASYQIILTVMLCYILYTRWPVSQREKGVFTTIFMIWGIGKAVFSLFEAQYAQVFGFYLVEILFSNVLNVCIFIIYILKTRSEISRADRIFKVIAENATDVIFYYTLGNQKGFSYISPSIERMTGHPPSAFYGNPKFYYEILDSSEYGAADEIFEGRKPEQSPSTNTLTLYHKNGRRIFGEITVTVIVEGKEPVAVEGFLRDVTITKMAEDELQASRKSRELLLSYVSHELRTPITSILGYVSALKDGTIQEEEEVRKAMDIVINKSITLERLINDLFQLSKLETKQFSFRFQKIEALDLTISLINKYTLDIEKSGLKLRTKIDYEGLSEGFLYADPERIEQVYANLISNAVKYTRPGDRLLLQFRTDKKKEKMLIHISDTGIGIAKGDIPYVFERFYRAESPPEVRKATSSGLGLTICKELVEAHEGQISVKSRAGKGSTFSVKLPMYSLDQIKEKEGKGMPDA